MPGFDIGDRVFDGGEVLLRGGKSGRVARGNLPRAVAEVMVAFFDGRAEARVLPITPRHAHRRVAHWLRAAGITRPASPHTMRHTFATRLLAKTHDIALVQKALRHRSIASTMVYAQMDDRRVREAIEG